MFESASPRNSRVLLVARGGKSEIDESTRLSMSMGCRNSAASASSMSDSRGFHSGPSALRVGGTLFGAGMEVSRLDEERNLETLAKGSGAARTHAAYRRPVLGVADPRSGRIPKDERANVVRMAHADDLPVPGAS